MAGDSSLSIEILDKVGEGNYGTVHLVRVNPIKKRYAMKVLNATLFSSKDRDMIQKELDIMAMLRHPNVIRYKRAFLTRTSEIHIIMEYADLGDLSHVVKDKENWEPSSVQLHDWCYQLVCGLEYIHSEKVVHRDLKPSNLLLKSNCGCVTGCQRTAVKIGDFGVSTVLKRDRDYKTATCIGTPYYLSPEICQGVEYGFKSDMWSLGCVLYELLSGRPPFLAATIEALVQKIVAAQYPQLASNADPVLSNLIPKLLNVNADDRPSSAFLKQLFSVQMDKRALHVEMMTVNKYGGDHRGKGKCRDELADKGSQKREPKKRRFFSAIEKSQHTKTPRGLRGNQNVFSFDKEAIEKLNGPTNPKPSKQNLQIIPEDVPPQSPNPANDLSDAKTRIDELLTRLDRNLGAELIGRCIDVYRQTKSISDLKGILGADNIACVSSILRLVYLEDQVLMADQPDSVEAANF